MKPKKQTTLLAITLIALLISPGCNKVYDYERNYPVVEHKFCRIEKLKVFYHTGTYPVYEEMKVSYDKHGNPVSILRTNEGPMNNREYHFRYDKRQRLTDYLITFMPERPHVGEALSVLTWHRYSYPNKNTIVDSAFHYVGYTDDPIPPNHSDYGTDVRHFELDVAGRIVKETRFFPEDENNLPPEITLFNYDKVGNLINPRGTLQWFGFGTIVYDDKVNIYRTHKVWMQIHADYSVNNPIHIPLPGEDHIGHEILEYNEYGLPLKYKAYSEFGNPYYLFGDRMGFNYNTLDVEYSCKGNHPGT